MKKVLVTGASGFCGRYLCRKFDSEGYEVTGTYRPGRHAVDFPWEMIPLDITSSSEVDQLFRGRRFDSVCHLAAQSVPRLAWQLEAMTFRANVEGTIYLLDAFRKYHPETAFLFTSTNQVYGGLYRDGHAVNENEFCRPENPYASSKAIAELACLNFSKRFSIPVVIARPFNHLGRGQADHFVFSDWCRQITLAEEGRRPPVLHVGNLDACRDFLHVEDVVDAYLLLLEKRKVGEIYNICTGEVKPLKDYVDFLLSLSRVPMTVEMQTARLRRCDPPVMRGNPRKMTALGWRPRRTARQALEELLEEWREKVHDLAEAGRN